MKKFAYIFALFTILAGTMSCSLDKLPQTQSSLDKITLVKDVESVRTGMYSIGRALFTGQEAFWIDYQSDIYNELSTSGNRGGFFFRWTIQSSDGDVQLIWEDNYIAISRANLVIASVDKIFAEQTPADQILLNRYKGEALLLRAMIFRNLALRFCVDYEPATANTAYGIPLQTEYVSDIITFVPEGRGTLQDTYDQILADIAAAKTFLTAANSPATPNQVYLNANSITAFEVQVNVDMHNYTGAIAAADPLIDAYPLVTTQAELEAMWWQDTSTETIFQFGITPTDRNAVLQYTDLNGGTYVASLGAYRYSAAYVPGQWVVDLYDEDEDLRYDVYISNQLINFGSTNVLGYVMQKFLGNTNLRVAASNPNWYTMAKVFRIADIILLKAEAEYRTGSDADALATLNTLRVSRGLEELIGITGDALFQEIKNERVRELIGEGGRIPDLKRWGDDFTRSPQPGLLFQATPGTQTLHVEAGATRFLLPIPTSEFGVNPNIAGQQNPGYNE